MALRVRAAKDGFGAGRAVAEIPVAGQDEAAAAAEDQRPVASRAAPSGTDSGDRFLNDQSMARELAPRQRRGEGGRVGGGGARWGAHRGTVTGMTEPAQHLRSWLCEKRGFGRVSGRLFMLLWLTAYRLLFKSAPIAAIAWPGIGR